MLSLQSQDLHNNSCEECGGGGELLECDHCVNVYHLVCVQPPLAGVPEGEWSCPSCVQQERKKQEKLKQLGLVSLNF